MCDAKRYSDQMQCACGLAWDVNDPDPPQCRRQRHVEPGKRATPRIIEARRELEAMQAASDGIVTALLGPKLPENLPLSLAGRMTAAYERAMDSGRSGTAAMQAAYRVLLDSLGE